MTRWPARLGLALGVFLVLLVAYGVLIEPRLILDEEHAEVPLPHIGERLAGTEVAVVSDFQLGMWFANTGMVEQAVETIVAAEPDVALLGGDFVYSTDPSIEAQIDTLLELLGPLLASGIPTFAVLGNHDHAVGAADELTTALEDAGVPVLRNEAVPVPGLGSAPLTLAGHPHCGQVALPGTPRWAYLALTSEERIVADGWAPAGYGAEGNRMFVTCGIGFSVAPIRVNAPPQVAFFELRPGD